MVQIQNVFEPNKNVLPVSFFLPIENNNIHFKKDEESCFNKVIPSELGKYILCLFAIQSHSGNISIPQSFI